MEASGGLPARLFVLSVFMVASFSSVQAEFDCVAPLSWKKNPWPPYFELSGMGCWLDNYETRVVVSNITYDILVRLCNENRYKLYIRDPVDKWWLDIVDLSGDGANHCELMGTDDVYREDIVTGPSRSNKTVPVYSRANWGEPFVKTELSLFNSPSWYECGISVTSSRKVYGKDHGCKEKEVVTSDKENKGSGLSVMYCIYLIAAGIYMASTALVIRIA